MTLLNLTKGKLIFLKLLLFQLVKELIKYLNTGEILGKRQSGLPSFNVADLSYDGDLLEEAKLNAEKIINNDPKLENHKNLKDYGKLFKSPTILGNIS